MTAWGGVFSALSQSCLSVTLRSCGAHISELHCVLGVAPSDGFCDVEEGACEEDSSVLDVLLGQGPASWGSQGTLEVVS